MRIKQEAESEQKKDDQEQSQHLQEQGSQRHLKKIEEKFFHLETLYSLFLIKILKFEGVCQFDARFSEEEKRILTMLLEAKNLKAVTFPIGEWCFNDQR